MIVEKVPSIFFVFLGKNRELQQVNYNMFEKRQLNWKESGVM